MAASRPLVLLCLLALVVLPAVQAADFFGIHSTNPPNFLAFYPDLREELLNITEGVCAATRQVYIDEPAGYEKFVLCNNMISCTLSNLSQANQAKISSATVMLGLTPVILATMGPSMAEVSLLSSHRPFLAMLLGLGSPSVFFERFATYSDPLEVLRARPGNLVIHKFRSQGISILISMLEYLFGMFAVVNAVTNSVQLGEWAVLSWRCADAKMVLLWSLLPVGIHAVAAVSFNISKASRFRPSASKDGRKSIIQRFILSELTLSANQPKQELKEESEHEGVLVVALQWVATLFSFTHLLFGTMVLSGLLFIVPKDSLSVVGRYMASAFVSRAIVIFEVAGLRDDPPPPMLSHLVHDTDNDGKMMRATGEEIGMTHVPAHRVPTAPRVLRMR